MAADADEWQAAAVQESWELGAIANVNANGTKASSN